MKRRVIIVMLAAIMGSGMCGCDINVSVNDDNGNETVTQSDDTDDEEDEDSQDSYVSDVDEDDVDTDEIDEDEYDDYDDDDYDYDYDDDDYDYSDDGKSNLYESFVGEYKQSDNDAMVSDGYLTIEESPDEVSIRFAGSDEWTKTDDCVIMGDGTLKVTCEYYVTEAEPDDLLEFTLELDGDDVLMTVLESDYPFLQAGDTVNFVKY